MICTKNPEGFTLLEVLVAVAILALGMLSILSLHNQSIRMSAEINNQTDAAMAGRIKMLSLISISDYDAFEAHFIVKGSSYSVEEAFKQFKFENEESNEVVGDTTLLYEAVTVKDAQSDKEIIKLEQIR
ncbi:MAG TPA: prepilin-type N-terminal cleavage/methylation domain-containing protein [bacterium]